MKYLAAGIKGLLGFASCGKSLVDDRDDSLCTSRRHMRTKGYGNRPRLGRKAHQRYPCLCPSKYSPWSKYVEETLYSDDKGAHQLTWTVDDLPPVTISFEDVDREENGGEFVSTEVTTKRNRTKDSDGTGS